MKAILAKEVRVGDVVEEYEGKPIVVAEVRENVGSGGYRRVELWNGGGLRWIGAETQVLALLHQPWPEGKTEENMQDAVMRCVRRVDQVPLGPAGIEPVKRTLDREIETLRSYIEAYELGKPEHKPEQPQQNESLMDKHMMP